MLLKIVQVGDPVLRGKARPLTRDEILSSPIQGLIDLMRETMRAAPGVGLAAPQVGESIQLAVIEDTTERMSGASSDDLDARERRPVPFHVLVNPVLTIDDPEAAEFFEGCLSFHGFSAIVPRAKGVRVVALDHRAEPVSISARGWYARILQHEIDHLSGTLCVDRMYTRTLSTYENLARFAR